MLKQLKQIEDNAKNAAVKSGQLIQKKRTSFTRELSPFFSPPHMEFWYSSFPSDGLLETKIDDKTLSNINKNIFQMKDFLRYCDDFYFQILIYLDIQSISNFKSTCTKLNSLLGPDSIFWSDFFRSQYIPKTLQCLKNFKISKKFSYNDVYNIAKRTPLCNEIKYDSILDVLKASSIDEQHEVPQNVLTVSKCFYLIKNLPHRFERMIPLLSHSIQQGCGCSIGNPCYWCSGPSDNADKIEYIDFLLDEVSAIIHSFSVTPFQVFFHPGDPIYCPQQVYLQLLYPSHSIVQSIQRQCKNRTICYEDIDDEELLSQSAYYTSPIFDVEYLFEEQYFVLPSPILCMGGVVRIVFKGMVERQRIEYLPTQDYFICISNVKIATLKSISLDSNTYPAEPVAFQKIDLPNETSRLQNKEGPPAPACYPPLDVCIEVK